MSDLYPFRRIPQGMVVIGSVFVVAAVAIAVGHFAFGVPVSDRNTGQPSSELGVAILILSFGSIGLLLALLGRVVLRAASRHHRKRTINPNRS